MRSKPIAAIYSLVVALFLITQAFVYPASAATAKLPLISPIFGDNMVLQRGKPNTLWGWSDPGQSIQVQIAGASATTTAGPDGRWQLQIQPPPAGGPYTFTIQGPQTVTLQNVLVGDVWLCGGQSNMQFGIANALGGKAEVAAADHPLIRLFSVENHPAYQPALVPTGQWKVCTPKTVSADGWGGFSAVGYYFGQKLQSELNIPVGLIQDCVGGTPAESWTSPQTLHQFKSFDDELAQMERYRLRGGEQYGNFIMHWYDDYDIGLKGNWGADDFDDSAWKPVDILGDFHELDAAGPSVCWFRKEITLPDPLPTGIATIYLGAIYKMDTTTINGKWVGASSWSENPRVYAIKPSVLHPGRNVVTIRVFKLKPGVSFIVKPDDLRLELGDKSIIPLATGWKGAHSVDARPPHPLPLNFDNYPTMPSVLYNGMIDPVAPLSITGAIWYQGEANTERAYQYRTLLPAMIGDWRRLFGQGDFPFYIAQLPAFEHRRPQPGDDSWAELREAQAMTARNVPNCGLAVTIDTGDPDNIHPTNKKPVGTRLALWALADHYGETIAYQSPTFTSAESIPGALKLHFEHHSGGLVVKGDKLEEFSIAGDDHVWHWADAKLDGNTVIVSSPDVPNPVAARYAWQANPAATLFNGAGLPATPFRTDDWPGVTQRNAQ